MAKPLAHRLRDLTDLRNSIVRGHPSAGPTSTQNNPSTVSTPNPPSPTSPSPEPPFTFLGMPRNNVFLKHRKPTVKGFKDQWTDEEYQQAATIAAQQDAINEDMDYSGTQWITAESTHFGDRCYPARLIFDFQRMMEIMVFRCGNVPAVLVTELNGHDA